MTTTPWPCPLCGAATRRNPLPGAHWYSCTHCRWEVTYYDNPYRHAAKAAEKAKEPKHD